MSFGFLNATVPRVSSVQPPAASTFFTQWASRQYVSATM